MRRQACIVGAVPSIVIHGESVDDLTGLASGLLAAGVSASLV